MQSFVFLLFSTALGSQPVHTDESHDSIQDRLDTLERLLNQQNSRLQRHEKVIEQLVTERKELRDERQQLLAEKQEWQTTRLELEARLKTAEAKIEELRATRVYPDALTGIRIERCCSDRSKWEAEREKMNHRIEELKRKVDEFCQSKAGTDIPETTKQPKTENEIRGKLDKSTGHPGRKGHTADAKQTSSPDGPRIDLNTRADDTGSWEPVVSQMSQRLTELDAQVEALKNANVQQDHVIQDSRGSVFTHWGSSGCPNTTQLVYSGIVGGSLSDTDSGAASNYLCLSLTPVLTTRSLNHDRAHVYGTEYETYESHDDTDAVCAVCRSQKATTIMVPGTNVCSPGWTLQYGGYLMAGYYGHPGASEYVCVDPSFEGRLGSEQGQAAQQFYFTTTVCGSLPCPPYHNDKVVTCAVCSK